MKSGKLVKFFGRKTFWGVSGTLKNGEPENVHVRSLESLRGGELSIAKFLKEILMYELEFLLGFTESSFNMTPERETLKKLGGGGGGRKFVYFKTNRRGAPKNWNC